MSDGFPPEMTPNVDRLTKSIMRSTGIPPVMYAAFPFSVPGVKQGANVSMPLVGWRASVPKNGQLELRNADGDVARLRYQRGSEGDISRILRAFGERPLPG